MTAVPLDADVVIVPQEPQPTITIAHAIAALIEKDERADRAKAEIGEALRCVSLAIESPDSNALRWARRCLSRARCALEGETYGGDLR